MKPLFLGRERELQQLMRMKELRKASLIVVRGRRRIGKSTLIEHFSNHFSNYIVVQGLAPREGIGNEDQLQHFCKRISRQLDLPDMKFGDWEDAFEFLAKNLKHKSTILFFDEISWMGQYDRDFVGKFKIAWDLHFKKCPNLLLVLCGSVSSWIDQNILNSTGMMGRVSLTLTLKELPLNLCNAFWRGKKISSMEKLKLLSVTGGVPRYLEEIVPERSADENIADMCFSPSGILFNEFESIFRDIFTSRAHTYCAIVECLVDKSLRYIDICQHLGYEKSGVVSQYLDDLESSGFISKDYKYSISSGKKGKFSVFRLKDNYLKFYLKCIRPKSDALKKGELLPENITGALSWDAIIGLQFENLVLNNVSLILDTLRINRSHLLSASPYFQNKTQRMDAVQVDLLIMCKHAYYICEIKFRKKVSSTIIGEMERKISKIKFQKNLSIRPVLIHAGSIDRAVQEADYFDHIIPFDDLLNL